MISAGASVVPWRARSVRSLCPRPAFASARSRREQRKHRQRLDARGPGHRRRHHEAQPAQAAGLAPAPLDGVVDADDTPSSVANPVAARLRHGPRRRIASVLDRPIEPPPRAPSRPIVQPRQPLGIAAHHRVAQRLPFHACQPRRLRPAQPVERVRDCVHPRRRPPVLLPPSLPPQCLRRQLFPDLECLPHAFPMPSPASGGGREPRRAARAKYLLESGERLAGISQTLSGGGRTGSAGFGGAGLRVGPAGSALCGATIRGEVAEKVVHSGEVRRVDQRAPVPREGHKTGMPELAEVE
jgi:hypothetical protein